MHVYIPANCDLHVVILLGKSPFTVHVKPADIKNNSNSDSANSTGIESSYVMLPESYSIMMYKIHQDSLL